MNPIPKKYQKKYNGCLPNPRDDRDLVLGDVAYVPDPNCPAWEENYNVEQKHGLLVRDHQGSSLSCVGQGWSKYLEMLNLIETNKVLNLSAKDIYSQIFLPSGGSYIRDGAKIAVKNGCTTEDYISSYQNGKPPSESFMRQKKQTPESKDNALIYQSKKFVKLDLSYPLTDQNWEDVRQVIWQYHGFVSGFRGHCIYFMGYGIENGKRFIKYINSYGKDFSEDGTGKWFDNFGELFDITFLVDQANIKKKI